MAQRLAGGNMALALLCNTVATAAALYVLITAFASISADFNPVVTLFGPRDGALFKILAQFAGAGLGVFLAHTMFGYPLAQEGTKVRGSSGEIIGEVVATAGLLFVIRATERTRPAATAAVVAAWIGAAYWFTSSTSFANPAVTWARTLTATFTSIRPPDATSFLWAQLGGAALGALLARLLFGRFPKPALAADESAAHRASSRSSVA